jgi:hypothetical protein
VYYCNLDLHIDDIYDWLYADMMAEVDSWLLCQPANGATGLIKICLWRHGAVHYVTWRYPAAELM